MLALRTILLCFVVLGVIQIVSASEPEENVSEQHPEVEEADVNEVIASGSIHSLAADAVSNPTTDVTSTTHLIPEADDVTANNTNGDGSMAVIGGERTDELPDSVTTSQNIDLITRRAHPSYTIDSPSLDLIISASELSSFSLTDVGLQTVMSLIRTPSRLDSSVENVPFSSVANIESSRAEPVYESLRSPDYRNQTRFNEIQDIVTSTSPPAGEVFGVTFYDSSSSEASDTSFHAGLPGRSQERLPQLSLSPDDVQHSTSLSTTELQISSGPATRTHPQEVSHDFVSENSFDADTIFSSDPSTSQIDNEAFSTILQETSQPSDLVSPHRTPVIASTSTARLHLIESSASQQPPQHSYVASSSGTSSDITGVVSARQTGRASSDNVLAEPTLSRSLESEHFHSSESREIDLESHSLKQTTSYESRRESIDGHSPVDLPTSVMPSPTQIEDSDTLRISLGHPSAIHEPSTQILSYALLQTSMESIPESSRHGFMSSSALVPQTSAPFESDLVLHPASILVESSRLGSSLDILLATIESVFTVASNECQSCSSLDNFQTLAIDTNVPVVSELYSTTIDYSLSLVTLTSDLPLSLSSFLSSGVAAGQSQFSVPSSPGRFSGVIDTARHETRHPTEELLSTTSNHDTSHTIEAFITSRLDTSHTPEVRITSRLDTSHTPEVRITSGLDTSHTPEVRITSRVNTSHTPEVRITSRVDTSHTPEVRITSRVDTSHTPEVRITSRVDTSHTPEVRITSRVDTSHTPEVRITSRLDTSHTPEVCITSRLDTSHTIELFTSSIQDTLYTLEAITTFSEDTMYTAETLTSTHDTHRPVEALTTSSEDTLHTATDPTENADQRSESTPVVLTSQQIEYTQPSHHLSGSSLTSRPTDTTLLPCTPYLSNCGSYMSGFTSALSLWSTDITIFTATSVTSVFIPAQWTSSYFHQTTQSTPSYLNTTSSPASHTERDRISADIGPSVPETASIDFSQKTPSSSLTLTPSPTRTHYVTTIPSILRAASNFSIRITFDGDCKHVALKNFTGTLKLNIQQFIMNISRIEDRRSLIVGLVQCSPNIIPVSFRNADKSQIFLHLNRTFTSGWSYKSFRIHSMTINLTGYEEVQGPPRRGAESEVTAADIAVIATASCICLIIVMAGIAIFAKEIYVKKFSKRFTSSNSSRMAHRTETVALTRIPEQSSGYNDVEMNEERCTNEAYDDSYDEDLSTVPTEHKTTFPSLEQSSPEENTDKKKPVPDAAQNPAKPARALIGSNTSQNNGTSTQESPGYGLVIGLMGYTKRLERQHQLRQQQQQEQQFEESSYYAVPQKRPKISQMKSRSGIELPPHLSLPTPSQSSPEPKAPSLPPQGHQRSLRRSNGLSDSNEDLLTVRSGSKVKAMKMGSPKHGGVDNPTFSDVRSNVHMNSSHVFHF